MNDEPRSDVSINLNDFAHVRLTPNGEKLFDQHYRDLLLDPAPYRRMYVQPDGRWRFQLHELMYIFGSGCRMGPIPPFETTFTVTPS